MNQSNNVSRSNQNADGTTSNSLTADAQQRLRLAAHILANGAIRAALKSRSQQADDELKKADRETNKWTKDPQTEG